MLDTAVTGAAFGAALLASGMYQPHLMASQFSFRRWNMVQTFLTATGCTALTVEILRRLGYAVPRPRSCSPIGLLPTALDGNILGGLVLGTGMALASSCPGVIFTQLAVGVPSARAAALGAAAGGLFWSAVVRPWIAGRKEQKKKLGQSHHHHPPETLVGLLGGADATSTAFVVLYGVFLAGAVAAAAARGPIDKQATALHPVIGGLAVGAAQLVSLLLRGSALGVSTCYEQAGDWALYTYRRCCCSSRQRPRPGASAMVFAASMVAGAWALGRVRPELAVVGAAAAAGSPSLPRAFAGGLLMAVGSRIAGGCTSGHGVSGMGLASVSSFATMFAAFGAAVAVSASGL